MGALWKREMEAIAALGLAATICQLVESSSKVFRETSEIVRSGQSVAVADLKLLANDLTKWTSSVENQLKKSVPNDAELSAEEQVRPAKRGSRLETVRLMFRPSSTLPSAVKRSQISC